MNQMAIGIDRLPSPCWPLFAASAIPYFGLIPLVDGLKAAWEAWAW